jgi:hypothetical protein
MAATSDLSGLFFVLAGGWSRAKDDTDTLYEDIVRCIGIVFGPAPNDIVRYFRTISFGIFRPVVHTHNIVLIRWPERFLNGPNHKWA